MPVRIAQRGLLYSLHLLVVYYMMLKSVSKVMKIKLLMNPAGVTTLN